MRRRKKPYTTKTRIKYEIENMRYGRDNVRLEKRARERSEQQQ